MACRCCSKSEAAARRMPARAAIAVRAEMEPCFAIHPPPNPVPRWGTPAQVITARMRGAGWCKQHICVFARPPWHVSGSGLDRACRDRARTALELTAPPTQPRTCTQAEREVDVTKSGRQRTKRRQQTRDWCAQDPCIRSGRLGWQGKRLVRTEGQGGPDIDARQGEKGSAVK